ncbi:hypothetical protein FUAX_51870 (plasmid) [Fulvitalea axinellae]|uniref:DUF4332 domain-containing protein n=1 Tax=Fulvitalea axinellae TaxID=1182444 RepID=A0AAU9CUL3_9BACT|nr:hypothetical protein FUAX_51870 [Fulvitalea axinellae]
MGDNQKISEIRKQIPIGILDAKRVLKQTGFNIEKAISAWKLEQVIRLSEIASITDDESEKLLEQAKFDLQKAHSSFRSLNTRDIDKIIESSNKESKVLSNFWSYIHLRIKEPYKNFNWITKRGFDSLPETISNILIVWQWYADFNYDGFSAEQETTSDLIKIFGDKLGLQDLSLKVKELKYLVDDFKDKHPFSQDNFEEYIRLRNQFDSQSMVKSKVQEIDEMEDHVMRQCYNYMIAHKDEIHEYLEDTNTYQKPK